MLPGGTRAPLQAEPSYPLPGITPLLGSLIPAALQWLPPRAAQGTTTPVRRQVKCLGNCRLDHIFVPLRNFQLFSEKRKVIGTSVYLSANPCYQSVSQQGPHSHRHSLCGGHNSRLGHRKTPNTHTPRHACCTFPRPGMCTNDLDGFRVGVSRFNAGEEKLLFDSVAVVSLSL